MVVYPRTLLSQLATARKSATGENAIAEMESEGGSATSMSLSAFVVALEVAVVVAVLLAAAPKDEDVPLSHDML